MFLYKVTTSPDLFFCPRPRGILKKKNTKIAIYFCMHIFLSRLCCKLSLLMYDLDICAKHMNNKRLLLFAFCSFPGNSPFIPIPIQQKLCVVSLAPFNASEMHFKKLDILAK